MSMKEQIDRIRVEIEDARMRAGTGDRVTLVGVTKTHPWEAVSDALESGLTVFGENRVQELTGKYPLERTGYTLRLIGHLQSNKVKQVIPYVDAIDSVDSLKILKMINKEAQKNGRVMPVLLQFNTSSEDSKSGFETKDELVRCIDASAEFSSVRIDGLMTIGPLTDDETAIKKSFSLLRNLQEELKERYRDLNLHELSMGMSSDYLLAIEMGSTMVRIGSAIFGARDYT